MDSTHCLDASRTALVVIDVQGSFRRIAHDADAVLARLESVIGTARAAGVLVVHTQQRHGERVPEIADPVAAADVVAHHNATFERLDHPGRSILVAPAERVRFSA